MLELDRLVVELDAEAGIVRAIDGIRLTLERGETFALVGESGCGKSMTALALTRLLPDNGRVVAGSIQLDGGELLDLPERAMRGVRGGRIGMIFQEPSTSLNPVLRVGQQIVESIEAHTPLRGAAARAKAIEWLGRVGIPEPERRIDEYPFRMSGGQKQRVMIAMTLAAEPDFLIADEPTTALDVTIQAQILALLRDLRAKLGMALLLITHDLGVVRKMADRVGVMRAGEIVEQGPAARLFGSPQHAYTQHLLAAEPKGSPTPPAADAPLVLEGNEVRVWFPIRKGVLRRTVGYVKAVDGVTLAVRAGETVGIVGESGSGKTTLGFGLLRLERSEGSIRFRGRELQGLRWADTRPLRREMQVVFQDPFASLSPRLPVGRIVGEGLEIHGIGGRAEREQRVIEVLEEVGVDPESRHRYPHEFSGGQRQRISIACSSMARSSQPSPMTARSTRRQSSILRSSRQSMRASST
jgi:microcin C transport system ATP-binding protein